jgi:hypothetical protein
MGDGTAAVDPRSTVNPGAIALQRRLTVSGYFVTTGRAYEADGVSTGDLRDTRFPLAIVEGQLGSSPLSFGLSYSLYADRTYELTTSDSVLIRGEVVGVDDRLSSDGGVADLRSALGWYVSRALQVGAAVHVLSGSTRERGIRTFDDPQYVPVTQSGDVSYTGWGVSAGAVYTPFQRLRLGMSVRRDSKLEAAGTLLPAIEIQLPTTVSGGFSALLLPTLRLSTSASWRSWAAANDDIPVGAGITAFDTWDVGTGLEFGGPDIGTSAIPLRVGVRYAQLPFSRTDEQAREIDLSAGSGFVFAGGRAMLEFALERVLRDGAGAKERAWQLSFGVVLRP